MPLNKCTSSFIGNNLSENWVETLFLSKCSASGHQYWIKGGWLRYLYLRNNTPGKLTPGIPSLALQLFHWVKAVWKREGWTRPAAFSIALSPTGGMGNLLELDWRARSCSLTHLLGFDSLWMIRMLGLRTKNFSLFKTEGITGISFYGAACISSQKKTPKNINMHLVCSKPALTAVLQRFLSGTGDDSGIKTKTFKETQNRIFTQQ